MLPTPQDWKQCEQASLYLTVNHPGRKNALIPLLSYNRQLGEGGKTPWRASQESWEELAEGQKELSADLAFSHQPDVA